MNEFTLGTMERDIQRLRTEFREALYEGLGFSSYSRIIKEGLAKCSGEFDEQTLKENLKEEFEDFLNMSIDAEKEA